MAILGARAAVDLVLPTGIDGSEIFRFEVFRGRKTAADIVAEAATVIGGVNQQLADQYGSIIYVTENFYGMTRQGSGSRTMTPLAVEFADSDPVRGEMIGNMLPLSWYQDALGWTERYLKYANDGQTTGDVSEIADRWRNRFDFQVVKRMLTNSENVVGTSGYDVGWAIGTGMNVNYIPPQSGAYVFTSSHSHYVVKDSASDDFIDLFEAMIVELRHHNILGRPLVYISESNLDTVVALSGFVKLTPQTLSLATGSTAPQAVGEFLGVPGELVGYYNSKRGLIEVRILGRMPAGYAWMTVPGGAGSPRNPLAIRVDVGESFGLRPDPQLTNSINPKLQQVNFTAEFGVGVNDRLAAVAGYIANGATVWVNPTDSTLGG